jgi:hypothetical protein
VIGVVCSPPLILFSVLRANVLRSTARLKEDERYRWVIDLVDPENAEPPAPPKKEDAPKTGAPKTDDAPKPGDNSKPGELSRMDGRTRADNKGAKGTRRVVRRGIWGK